MRSRLRALALLVTLAGCSEAASPPAGDLRGIIAGTVIGAMGRPLAGALVTTAPASQSVHTDAAGRFTIVGISEGSYRLTVARDGAKVTVDSRASVDTTRLALRLPIWRLVWSDEFEGDAVNPQKWRQPEGDAGNAAGLTRYRRHAATVADGRLRLTTAPDTIEPGRYAGAMVVSGEMFTYGRFEIRAKLPRGRGLWPAHWLWPLDRHSAPEIDIMEMLGHDPQMTYATYHWGDSSGARHSASRPFRGFDRSQEFYTYALEWYPGEAVWYIDDLEVFRTPMIQPDEPMNLIVNTAIGGDWGGDPDSTTVFPQYHDVDYVRVYAGVD